MKKFRNLKSRISSLAMLLVLSVAQAAGATSPFIKPATVGATSDKIRICHRSASYTNPYQDIEVSKSAADGLAGNSGNEADHYGEHKGPLFYPTIPKHTEWGDIIPPIAGVHDGLNWTAEGEAIWNNDCDVKNGDLVVNKKVDADGNGVYEGSNGTANTLGFRWGYNGNTPDQLMGDDIDDLPVGGYVVTENNIPNYTFKGWYYTDEEDNSGDKQVNCAHPQGTTLPVSVEVKKDKKTEVTLCNQKVINNGSITIIKDTQPDHHRDFPFTTTGNGLSEFTLDDDADPTYSNTKTFTGLGAGAYSVTESAVDGWYVDSINCGQATGVQTSGSTVNITLAAGQNVTCTFVNKHKTGTVKVLKQVDEGEGYASVGAESPFRWGLDGGTINRDMGSSQDGVPVGNRTVTENSVTDYEIAGWFIGEGSCTNPQNSKTLPVTVNVQQGQTSTVTFCNRIKEDKKIGLCHATGSESNPFVLINISPAGAFNGHLDESNGGGATQGNHQWGEDIIPEFTYNGQTYSQNYDAVGQAIFKDGCKLPSKSKITGYKFHDLNGNGQKDGLLEAKIGGWTIYLYKVGNPTPIATTTTSNSLANYGNFSFNNLPAGDYKVCEAHPAGWVQIVPNPTDNNGCYLITLNGVNEGTAIFGNQARAKIKVIKNVDKNGDGDVDDPYEKNNSHWSWNYLSLLDSDNNVQTGTGVEVRTGTYGTPYLLSENQKDGYDLTDVDCNENFWRIGDSVKVFASAGDYIVCTFTNTKRAKVVIEKKADPEDGTNFKFKLSKKSSHDSDQSYAALFNGFNDNHNNYHDDYFILDDAKYDDGDNYTNKEQLSLKTGYTYYITEKDVEGWDLDKIQCSRGVQWYRDGSTLVLYVNDADDIYCYFKNEKRGEVVVTKFNDYDRDGEKDENEPTLPGWDMTLESEECEYDELSRVQSYVYEHNYDCDNDYEYNETQTTGEDGATTFTGVKPEVEHILSESLEGKDGWHWSNTYCEYKDYEHGDYQYSSYGAPVSDNRYKLTVEAGETLHCFVGNYQDVALNLTKSNNRPDPTVVGDTVTYTLVASLEKESGPLFGVTVTDLPPAGFVYVPGSWTAVSNFRGNLVPEITTEPNYSSPGTWQLGDMLPGEIVTLTYMAKIAQTVSNGTYPDVAFAQGCANPNQIVLSLVLIQPTCSQIVYSNVHRVDTPFVDTQVTVTSPQVLGASTTLVDTGAAEMWRTLMAATLLIGLALATIVRREKKGGAA